MNAGDKITKLIALQMLAQKLKAKTPINVSDLVNDSGYQTGAQVEAAIAAKISSTYWPGGSVAFAALPELTGANLGVVVNVTDSFITTADFLEGAGIEYPAGTNVAVVQAGQAYKYDALAGFVDLSGLVEKEDGKTLSSNDYTDEDKAKLDGLEFATDAEVAAMLAEVFGE